MGVSPDRILIVETDPAISDLIGRQALQSIGYQVQFVEDATAAIPQVRQFQPAALILDLDLPGLSGKDLLVALSSQRITLPTIVVARRGMEADIIQAFRLGATDYILWPVRDAEVVTVVERVLRQVRERSERDSLARQLQQTNQELQSRVRELTSIVGIAKAVTPLADPHTLFDRLVDGVVRITSADLGWLMMREDPGKDLQLVAGRHLPEAAAAHLNRPWDDGISQVTALSGETVSMYGDSLKRLQVASLGQAVLAVPVKIQKQVMGMLVAVRKAPRPFSADEQKLLEAVADYAGIALTNLRAFRSLEDRARLLQQSADTAQAQAKSKSEALQRVVHELQAPLEIVRASLDILIEGKKGKLPTDQRQILVAAYDKMRQMSEIVERAEPAPAPAAKNLTVFNLNNLVRQALGRFSRAAYQCGVTLTGELSPEPIFAWADSSQITQAVDNLLNHTTQSTPRGSKIVVRTLRDGDNQAHVVIQDGEAITPQQMQHLFDRLPGRQRLGSAAALPVVKELISASGGKIWAESKPDQGTTFHFTLLPPKDKPSIS